MNILDLFFPKKCVNCKKLGDYLCPNCFARLSFDVKTNCIMCSKPAIGGITHPKCLSPRSISGSFSAITFNRIAKKLVYSFKYKPYLSDLREFLGSLMFESFIQKEEFNTVLKEKNLFFVPIPLFVSKFKKRGYNQAEILAHELSKRFNFPVLDALERMVDTKTQTNLNKENRQRNIAGVFKVSTTENIKDKNIFLVDDVLTSGATLKEAARILKKNGAKNVWALTLAQD